MCGIAGYIGLKRFENKNINKILESMKNRGPDSFGFKETGFNKKFISLFFARLNIIDDMPRSNQPFSYKDKLLIFNGEIYNYLELKNELLKKGYSFKTTSDTEVLIKVLDFWGESGIKKLEGMWSFFFYDKTKKRGILCRDRFGEKPLFYYHKENNFVFASEIKTLHKIIDKHKGVNINKIDDLLRYGYRNIYKDNKTFFNEIIDFPKGHYLIIENNKIVKKRYWDIKPKINKNSEKENLTKIKDKLFDSIKTRLRSDFPIAFFLSGGIDSNALAFIAKKYFNYDVKTFSIIGSDTKYDESKAINYSVKKLGVEHQSLKINFEKYNFFNTLREQALYHDAPVTTINSLLQFSLLKKIKKKGYKIAISGIGADEIFSGYYDHHLAYLESIKNNKKLYKFSLDNWKKNILPVITNPLLKNHKAYNNKDFLYSYVYQQEDFKKKIFIKQTKKKFKDKNFTSSILKNRLANQIMYESLPVLLKEDDLNSMYHSIENRSPFLDSRLTEACFNMPQEHYIQNGLAKSPLRKIIDGIVPNKIRLNKLKTGFNAPIEHVFDFKNKKNLEFILKDSQIFDIVDKKFILKLINKNKNYTAVENIFLFNFLSSKLFLEKTN